MTLVFIWYWSIHYGFHSFPVVDWFCLFICFEFWLSLCKIVRSSVVLLLPLCNICLFMSVIPYALCYTIIKLFYSGLLKESLNSGVTTATNIKKERAPLTFTYSTLKKTLEIQVPILNRHKRYGGVKPVKGI